MKNNFGTFVHKEMLHIIRDKRTLLIVLLIPVILMLLFGFAISTEVNNVKVAAVSDHPDEEVLQMVDRIDHNPYFSFCGFIDNNQIDKVLRTGEALAVVVFGDQKQTPQIQVILDGSDTNTARAATMYLQNVLTGESVDQSAFETRLLFNPQMRSAYNFVPGIMGLIFILVCALMTSVSIVREKEIGTMEVLLVSPVNPVKIVFSKMIPYFMISCVTLAVILLLSHFVLDVPLSTGGVGGVVSIVGISLLYILLALSLGLLVSNLAKSQVVAMLISAAVMLLPVIMLSGMIFPIENFPFPLKVISCIVPARWYIDAMRKMMIEGLPLVAVMKDVIILAVMTLVLIVASLKKFSYKLE